MMENPQYPNNPPPSPYHQRGASIPKQPPSHHSDNNDPTTAELRALDCNLTSLCEHVQIEGFNSGSFSDIVVNAMGSTYHLHRLILSRSSYFRSFSLQLSLISFSHHSPVKIIEIRFSLSTLPLFRSPESCNRYILLHYVCIFGEVFKCMFGSPMTKLILYNRIYFKVS